MRRSDALLVLKYAFDAMGILHFTPQEFLPEGRPAPPLPLLSHILPTAKILDWARKDLGAIHVNSGYREPAYNATVGGSPRSQHMSFTAADVTPMDVTPDALHAWLSTCGYAARLGLGRYDTFVHVDTRHWIGMPKYGMGPARWDNRT